MRGAAQVDGENSRAHFGPLGEDFWQEQGLNPSVEGEAKPADLKVRVCNSRGRHVLWMRRVGMKEEQENSAGRDSACVVGSSHYSDKVTRTI